VFDGQAGDVNTLSLGNVDLFSLFFFSVFSVDKWFFDVLGGCLHISSFNMSPQSSPSGSSGSKSIDEQREVLMDILHRHLEESDDNKPPIPPRRSSNIKGGARSGGSRREKKPVLFLFLETQLACSQLGTGDSVY
jgi:hypothetical protein